MSSPWPVRITTFAIWSLAAGSAVFWALRFSAAPAGPNAATAAVAAVVADPQAIARLLGAGDAAAIAPAAAPALAIATRYALLGLAAGAGSHSSGVAVISVDGKPPRPYGVGSAIEEGVVLQSVAQRRVVLATRMDGPPLVTLEMAPKR